MVRKSEPDPARRRELGAVAARAEQPNRRQCDVARDCAQIAERMTLREAAMLKQQQFLKAFKKFIAGARVLPGAQRIGRDWIGPGGAAEPEIDPAGK